MAIRPIDLQLLVPKSVDTGKVEQVIRDSTDAARNQLTIQYQQNLESAKRKVLEKNRADYAKCETHLDYGKSKGQGTPLRKRKKSRQSYHIDIIV